MLQAALPPEPPQQAIIVTGRALPRPASEKILHSEALSADVLRSAPSRSVERLLDRFTGVQLFRRSDSRTAHPTSQGVTIRALGGNAASRVQLLLDGVPQSDPFGGWIDWAAFNPDDLREIRLTRGGGSVVTGPGALGGTIELVTASDPMISASVDHGSRESLEVNFSARGRLGSGS